MEDRDTDFCAQTLRHAALGALIGGPVAAAAGWALSQRYVERIAPSDQSAPGLLSVMLATACLLLGVWIGATVGCGVVRRRSAEDTCYGGVLGCMIYVVGGAVGVLLGRWTGLKLHPLIWYLIGGSLAALIAFCLGAFSPFARCACNIRTRNG